MRNIYSYAALAAAVIYNIWPLAYILNPAVLNGGYISTLQATGQPYYQLFVAGDILTGLLLMILCLLLYRNELMRKDLVAGLFIFGLTTLIAAIIPIAKSCTYSISKCGIGINSVIEPHDLMSIIGAFALLYCLYKIYKRTRSAEKRVTKVILLSWCITGVFLALSVTFNFLTLLSQALFLLTCGLAVIFIPIYGSKLNKNQAT